jgi:hypothetical protein
MNRKVLSFIVVAAIVVLAASLLFSCGDSAPKWDIGGDAPQTVFASLKDGTLTISGKGKIKNFREWKDRPWNEYRSAITKVIIKKGVTSIGDNTFNGCSNLTSVSISNSVTSIGKYAFRSCSSITSIAIPNSVTYIGPYAFLVGMDGGTWSKLLITSISGPYTFEELKSGNELYR